MENAKQVIQDVTSAVTQKSSSHKDEITVMKAMLNDLTFSVDVYDKQGKVDEYCPSSEVRKVLANVVSVTTKMPAKEAQELVNHYEFSKADASAMVNLSKEFINTYLHTGRKLPIGGRVNSNIELLWKEIADHTVEVPNGDSRSETFIPAHGGIKAFNPCPNWISLQNK